jgi:hypothetical protein
LLLILSNKSGSLGLVELWNEYRELCKSKVNYDLVRRHVDFMRDARLVEVEKGRPMRVRVSQKGRDYMFLMSRLEYLLGRSISCS